MTDYDAVVIGAGQAGPGVAAARAQSGRRVALIEMEQVGGTCLNHGCKPTKALRASGVVAQQARRSAGYGVHTGEVRVDFGQAIGRVHRLIDGMRDSLRTWIDGVENLDLLSGSATLRTSADGPHRIGIGDQELATDEVYLDVGSRATVPRIPGLDEVSWMSEVELLALTELPRHLIVVGGGYIGLEFGQMFRRFGADVTILAGGGVASREDEDVSDLISEILTAEGVTILGLRPAGVRAHADGVEVQLSDQGSVVGSHLLVATGRRSNSDLLGEHGIDTDERGFFTIGPRFETSVRNVWALGDVNGHGAFTHTAYQDGQILLDESRTVTGRVTTYAMFTDPPLGRVGMTVREARESGRRVLKAEVPMSGVSRAVLEGETSGLMRILVDADTSELLGATILGLHADDLVQVISFALQAGVPYQKLRDALPIHPTMAEYIPSVLGSLQPL